MSEAPRDAAAAAAAQQKMEESSLNDGHASHASQLESGNSNSGVAAGTTPPPASKKAKLVRSLKRYWWAYLIVFLCAVVLGVMLTIFVGVKDIAQSKINKAVLEVQGISCTNTRTDGFTLGINTTLKSGTTKATVRKFEGVMYLEDEPSHTPFVTIDFPETKNQRFQTINITQDVTITNKAALTQFNAWLLNNKTVRVTVLGHPRVKVPGISKTYGVTFKKTVELPGLNGFEGIRSSNGSISLTTFADGTNFHATATIPNSSLMTFEIGNATFDSYLTGGLAGTSYLENVTLRPGTNVLPFKALMSNTPVLNGVQTQPYCENGTLPFQLSGREVVNNGQELTYFAEALAVRNTTIEIDIDTPLSKLGVHMSCPTSTANAASPASSS